jgi:ABC-2 type transport system permease protein
MIGRPRFFGRMLAISAKEVQHIRRDVRVIYASIGIPLLLLVLFGYGVVFETERVPFAVVDADQSPASRRLIEAFRNTGIFEERAQVQEAAAVEALFRRGEAKVGLIIDAGYQRDLKRGRPAKAQVLVDGADSSAAKQVLGYLAALEQSLGADGQAPPRSPDARIQVRFNPGMKSPRFVIPGLMAIVLATLGVTLTAMAVASEWERGSIEQLFATPVTRVEVILGKLLPYCMIGMLQLLLLLVFGVWVFDLPAEGEMWLVMAASFLFLAGMLAQGLFISAATRKLQAATEIGMVSTIMPTLLLSGFLFPVENMPPVLKAIASILPARYFIDALRTVLLKGGGREEIALDLWALVIFAVVMTLFATLRFRRRIA